MNGPPAPIKTPCIKVCVVDGESGLCLGCYRKLSEVAAWTRLSDIERDTILVRLAPFVFRPFARAFGERNGHGMR